MRQIASIRRTIMYYSYMYIYEDAALPEFTYDLKTLLPFLCECHRRQGELIARISVLGLYEQENIALSVSAGDVVHSSEIEGISLNREQVRSSIAIRLGLKLDNAVHPGHNIDAVVSMMMEACRNYNTPLTDERLFSWHAALFPTGYSGRYKINVVRYRTDPMQVISGILANEIVHYETPSPECVSEEM